MNFGNDFYTLITGDSSINGLTNGGIYYENLPTNFSLEKYWIVYSYNKTEQQNTFNHTNFFSKYNVITKIIGPDSAGVDNLTNLLQNYLNRKQLNGIEDIYMLSDDHAIDLDQNVYSTELIFEAFYVKK